MTTEIRSSVLVSYPPIRVAVLLFAETHCQWRHEKREPRRQFQEELLAELRTAIREQAHTLEATVIVESWWDYIHNRLIPHHPSTISAFIELFTAVERAAGRVRGAS